VNSADEIFHNQFAAWYESDMQRLYSYIAYRVRDKAAAEELTSAVCEKALLNLHRYDAARAPLHAWVLGFARHEVQHYFRDQLARPEPLALEALPDIQARGSTVEESAHRALLTRKVLEHIDQLSEREQDILALRFGAELPHDEIARTLGLTSGNVRVLTSRALEKLQRLLQDETEANNA
jgi:RNA polymerase sigma factor (sigma-70 family)